MASWKGTPGSVTIAITLTTIDTITVHEGANFLICEMANANISDLDQFTVQYKAHADGSFIDVATVISDFTNPNAKYTDAPVVWASSNPCALVKNTSVFFKLHVKGVNAVRLKAAATGGAGSTTSVTLYWQAR